MWPALVYLRKSAEDMGWHWTCDFLFDTPSTRPTILQMSSGSQVRLGPLLRHYRGKHKKRLEAQVKWMHGQPSLARAIAVAAWAVDERGKRYRHQTRIRQAALRRAERTLLGQKKHILHCRSFDELHGVLVQWLRPVAGLGELYCYDTCLRLSAYLHLKPMRVYLHSGTRAGAKNLGLDWHKDALEMHELPRGLDDLTPAEAEDFLCIYKAAFKGRPQVLPRGCWQRSGRRVSTEDGGECP